jgi:CubicO group peptidase (beta-lactamase class C family)
MQIPINKDFRRAWKSRAALCAAILFCSPVQGQVISATAPHHVFLEGSWDLGDLGPDWRDELVIDPTAPEQNFFVRWLYSGPGFSTAVLQFFDSQNALVREIPLPNTVANDFWRYLTLTVGDLPSAPHLKARVRLRNNVGGPAGDLSNPVTFSHPGPTDPFLYTPLFIESVLELYRVPGIGSSVALPGELFGREWFRGKRRVDQPVALVERGDLWHIGSDTKAMTCTLLGILIQEEAKLPGGGVFTWDTRLSAVFPEWAAEMHARFINTTIRHLACHRSGLRMTAAEDAETRVTGPGSKNEDPRAFRREMSHRLLLRNHFEAINGVVVATSPGGKWFYGSGNYLILGAVIEQLTGQTYEQAMRERLFRPLAMLTAGFGMPVDRGPDQPNGHRRGPEPPHFAFIDNTPLPPVWNPAGGAFLSLEDWLKFCRVHLTGQQGLLTLNPATLNELQTPHPRQFPALKPWDADPSYGWGWGIDLKTGNRMLGHDGTYGRFYARVTVHLDRGYAVVTAVNIGPEPYEFGVEATAAMHTHMIRGAENWLKQQTGGPVGGAAQSISFEADGEGRFRLWTGGEGVSGVGGRMQMIEDAAAGFPHLPVTFAFGELAHPILHLENAERGRLRLRFHSEPRKSYILERTADLEKNGWEVHSTFTEESGQAQILLPVEERAAFFRLRLSR